MVENLRVSRKWVELRSSPVLRTFILIDTLSQHFDKNLECEIAVVRSTDNTQVRIARLDKRQAANSVNYFVKSPNVFAKYGLTLDLDREFQLHGAPVAAVHSSFNVKDNHYDLKLQVTIVNAVSGEETVHERVISLETQFFKDVPKIFLK